MTNEQYLHQGDALMGMGAAHAVVTLFRRERDWQAFYDTYRNPQVFAARAFPPADYSNLARDGFVAVFEHLRAQKGVLLEKDKVIWPKEARSP